MIQAGYLPAFAATVDEILAEHAAHLVMVIICDHIEDRNTGKEVAMIKLVQGPSVDDTERHREIIKAITDVLTISLGEPIRG